MRAIPYSWKTISGNKLNDVSRRYLSQIMIGDILKVPFFGHFFMFVIESVFQRAGRKNDLFVSFFLALFTVTFVVFILPLGDDANIQMYLY